MKIELCSFSGYKIYPGRGKKMVKIDGRIFNFRDHKCERSYAMKRNPRKVNWTVLYRRKHKKGLMVEEAKKRTRRTTKFKKAIVGATLSDIMARRNETPEFRKAQREEAIRALKEKKRLKEEKKNAERIAAEKAEKAAQKAASKQNKQKQLQKKAAPASKTVKKAAPRVGGKR